MVSRYLIAFIIFSLLRNDCDKRLISIIYDNIAMHSDTVCAAYRGTVFSKATFFPRMYIDCHVAKQMLRCRGNRTSKNCINCD